MSELTNAQQAVLAALWTVPSGAPAGPAAVREQAALMGHPRTLASIQRTLDQLVDLRYAKRLMIRLGEHGTARPLFVPTTRAGDPPETIDEEMPSVCEGSAFLTWLWRGRESWRLWSLQPAERKVWIDNWAMRASEQEWAWLASRPMLMLDGEPVPDDPAWWERDRGVGAR